MPAARLWRITGIDPHGAAGLELSALHLYDGAGRVDAAAALTCSHIPSSGTLAALQDDASATLCAFDSTVVRSPGFWLQWDMGAGNTADVWGLRVGAGVAKDAFLSTCFLQYFDGSAWVTAECGAYPWPGGGMLTAAPLQRAAFGVLLDVFSRTPLATWLNWRGAAISPDGQLVLACTSSGYIYKSTDGGASFTTLTAAGTKNWMGVAMSGDGQVIVGTANYDFLQKSSDGGATWSSLTAAGSRTWTGVAVSPSGTTILAVAGLSSQLYKSTDSGATWVTLTIRYDNWYGMGLSADAQVVVMSATSGNIYKSTDGGATWVVLTAAGARQWYGVALSPDGQTIVGAVGGGYCQQSLDGGVTWASVSRAGSSGWYAVATTNAGARMVLGDSGNGLYVAAARGQEFLQPRLRAHRTQAAPVFTRPVGNLRTIAAQRQRLTRDTTCGGNGAIRDTVELKGTPSNTPLRRRVRLYSDRSGEKARETWSDAATGTYEFTGLDTAQQFTALAVDHERVHQAVAADNLTPKVLP